MQRQRSLEQARLKQRGFGKLFGTPAKHVFPPGKSQAAARAGGIANPLLRAISFDSDRFIRQHLSHEDTVAVPIHPNPTWRDCYGTASYRFRQTWR
jgi:hypothetical protein